MEPTKTKTDLGPYIVNVQGKDFITFPGLLQEAHAIGLVGVETELLNPTNLDNPVFKAVVTLENQKENVMHYKKFTGYGDANVNNVAKKVSGALIRMAETRAIARALRFACNISMAALEELDSEDNVISNNAPPKNFTGAKTFGKPAVSAAVKEEVKSSVAEAVQPVAPITASTKPTFARRKLDGTASNGS